MRWTVGMAGIFVLLFVWLGPLPALARQAFSAHMTMHVMVLTVSAPLLTVALAGGRYDPVWQLPALFSPALAATLEFVVVWAWHAPALHQAARQSTQFFVLEQGSYLAVGLLVWLAAFGGDRRKRGPMGIAGLLLTSMHMTLLGVLLALASRPLYQHGELTLMELSSLQDQQLGGVIMLVFGGSTYLLGGLYLLAKLLGSQRTPSLGKPNVRSIR